MAKTQVQKAGPSLKVVADAAAAAKLRELIKDADDGLRRVVKCGLYIEWMAAHLPHGALMSWLEAHCPDVAVKTVYRWRSLAKNMMEWAGFKFVMMTNLADGDQFLTVPIKELPPALRPVREKMEELLDSAKTPKQLFFDMGFKQGELGGDGYPKARRGRLKGCNGTTREQRADARARQEALEAEEASEMAVEWARFTEEQCDNKHLGNASDDAFKRAFDAYLLLKEFMEPLAVARGLVKGGKR